MVNHKSHPSMPMHYCDNVGSKTIVDKGYQPPPHNKASMSHDIMVVDP